MIVSPAQPPVVFSPMMPAQRPTGPDVYGVRSKLNSYARLLLAGALLLIARGTIGVRQRTDFMAVDSYAAAEATIVLGMALLMACKPAPLLLVWRRLSGTSGRPFLIFCIFSIATALWSSIPAYSAFRAGEFASQVFALFVVMALAGNAIAREKLLISCCLAVIGLEIFEGVRLSSAFGRDDAMCISAAMVLCYGFGEFPGAYGRRRTRMLMLCLIGLGGMVVGRSLASSWALCLIVFVTAIISRRHRRFALLIGLVVLLGSVLAVTDSDLAQKIVTGGRSAEEIQRLTGRRALWESYWDKFCEQPLIGYGYAVSSKTQGLFQATHTHSTFFSVILAGGLIGLAFAVWPVFLGIKEGIVMVKRQRPGCVGCFCALGIGLINSLSIAFLAEIWTAPSFVFIMIYAFHLFTMRETSVRSDRNPSPGQMTGRALNGLVPRRRRFVRPHFAG
jgi:O-antigen ligase